MTNLECTVLVIELHREGRAWNDHAVGAAILAKLGIDPDAVCVNATPIIEDPPVTEAQLEAAYAEAKMAAEVAQQLHETWRAQNKRSEPEASALVFQTEGPGAMSTPLPKAWWQGSTQGLAEHVENERAAQDDTRDADAADTNHG
jgi:hypothetical protein